MEAGHTRAWVVRVSTKSTPALTGTPGAWEERCTPVPRSRPRPSPRPPSSDLVELRRGPQPGMRGDAAVIPHPGLEPGWPVAGMASVSPV